MLGCAPGGGGGGGGGGGIGLMHARMCVCRKVKEMGPYF